MLTNAAAAELSVCDLTGGSRFFVARGLPLVPSSSAPWVLRGDESARLLHDLTADCLGSESLLALWASPEALSSVMGTEPDDVTGFSWVPYPLPPWTGCLHGLM